MTTTSDGCQSQKLSPKTLFSKKVCFKSYDSQENILASEVVVSQTDGPVKYFRVRGKSRGPHG